VNRSSSQHCVFALLILFSSNARTTLAQGIRSPEAPLVGRKEPFCGGIGTGRFEISTSAIPTKLEAGEPILLTIHIRSVGQWLHAPSRPDLIHKAEYDKFRQAFHIQNGPERSNANEGIWEFDYSLRPKNGGVKEIPSVVIIYFRPGLTPAEKGYMTTSAPPTPLQVSPRTKVEVNEIQGKVERTPPPERFYEIARGPEVLRSDSNWLPVSWLVVVLAICPPALSLGWLVWWNHQNPAGARRARLRRSRAARQALQALRSCNGVGSKEEARRVSDGVSDYLKLRFDHQVPQDLPWQTAISTRNENLGPDCHERIAVFFRACERIQYAPPPIPNGANLAEMAANLILDLESRP
jgi:hypothetical protein